MLALYQPRHGCKTACKFMCTSGLALSYINAKGVMLHVTLVFTLGVVPVSQPQELSQWCSHLLYTQPGCIMWRQLVEHSYVLPCTHIVIHQKHIDCSLHWLNKHLIHLDSMLVKFCCHYIFATNQLNVSHPAQPTCSAWNQCIPERLSFFVLYINRP